MGRHMDAMKPQVSDKALMMMPADAGESSHTVLREEIIVEDGIVEDIIAVDYKSM